MSSCPVVMLSNLSLDSSSPPSSPLNHTRLHRLGSNSSTILHKLPNIVAHATPSSPSAVSAIRFSMASSASSSPPPSPGCRKIATSTSILSNVLTITATTTPPIPISSVPCNARKQPVAQRPARKAGKRKLGPGCGLLDWIKLCRSKTNLTGNGGAPRPVTLEELAEHNKEEDAWTAIRGKVYNLTYYMKFHPGGRSELMRGAGIDCTILFDEAHKWVNVESTLKACYVGPLVASSPNTQRKKSTNIVKNSLKLRKESLTVPTTLVFTEGVNKQAVSSAVRKNSMTLRNATQAATACEETDGRRQISPESPVKPIVGEPVTRKISTATQEAASNAASIRLSLPPTRIRRTSEPHPRFDWVQSEKAVTLHIYTKKVGLKVSDVTIDANEKTIEAAVFIYDWVFEVKLDLAHAIVGSQVNVNHGHVEVLLKKEDPSIHWESVGTPRDGHLKLQAKSKRGTKYHSTRVENIRKVTHDTKLYTLRLPAGSYLNVPTGHHLSIKANIDGETVERSYTPISALEALPPRHGQQPTPQDGNIIDLMVKLYSNGKMSRFLSELIEGDEVIVSDSEGSFDSASRLKSASDVLLIAAGSGFTPMVKILRDYLLSEVTPRPHITSASEACGEEEVAPELPPSNTETDGDEMVTKPPKTAKLLFANKKERDIMYREELDHLVQSTVTKFKVTHILSEANSCWDGFKGRIGRSLLESNLPTVKEENRKSTLVCVCGPEPFLANISNILLDMEFPDECIQCFQ